MNEFRKRAAAMFAMALCCGAAMAVTLGLVVVTGAWFTGGLIGLIIASCIAATAWAAKRTRNDDPKTKAEPHHA